MKAMAKLTQNIKKSKVGSKDYQVLLAAEDAIRSLNGGRAVCCKSAKDRTSMAVTLEEARLLCAHHGLPGRLDHDFDPDILCAANHANAEAFTQAEAADQIGAVRLATEMKGMRRVKILWLSIGVQNIAHGSQTIRLWWTCG